MQQQPAPASLLQRVLGPSSLWKKEFRDRLPFLAFMLVTWGGLELVYALLTGFPDRLPLDVQLLDYDPAEERAGYVILFFITLALASGLLVGERDRGTLEFLDALPVSRTQVFFAKVGTAVLTLFSGVASYTAVLLFLHALSRNSLDPGFHLPLLFLDLFISLCQLLFVLGIALLLSFLRRFAWLVAGLLLVLWRHLSLGFPALQLLDMRELGIFRQIAERKMWSFSWGHLGVQLFFAALCLAASWRLFLGGGEGLLRGLDILRTKRKGRILLFMGAACAVILWVVLFGEMMWTGGLRETSEVRYPDWQPSRLHTDAYVFTFRSDAAGHMRSLAPGTNEVIEKVGGYFETALPGTIAVDLTRPASPGILGHAHWKTIVMDLATVKDQSRFNSILAHETAHVFVDYLSDNRLHGCFRSSRFFHEGMATYVQYHFFEPPESLDALRLSAAILRDRGDMDVQQMMEDAKFSRRHDPMAVYPLGESFIAALVERYGENAPERILRAFTREDAPRDLEGEALWQEVFQAAGYNLDEAIGAYYDLLDRNVETYRETIEQLPAPVGRIVEEEDGIRIEPIWKSDLPWTVLCRFRKGLNADPRDYIYACPDEEGTFQVPTCRGWRRGLWYQLGLKGPGDEWVLWEPWVPIPD